MVPHYCLTLILGLTVLFQTSVPVFSEASATLKSYNSPIVDLEPEKGFFLITIDSGIQWIQVEDKVKDHLKTLANGDIIDVVVELRPDKIYPLLRSWKLARSASPCKIFDGQTCRSE